MAFAMPQAIERLLATPTIKARLPARKPIDFDPRQWPAEHGLRVERPAARGVSVKAKVYVDSAARRAAGIGQPTCSARGRSRTARAFRRAADNGTSRGCRSTRGAAGP